MKFVPVKDAKGQQLPSTPTRMKDYAAFAAENPEAGSSWKSQKKDGILVGEGDDCPVVGVNWTDSQAFCAWLGREEGKTYRMPTDHEWSIAVGIGQMEKVTKDTSPGGTGMENQRCISLGRPMAAAEGRGKTLFGTAKLQGKSLPRAGNRSPAVPRMALPAPPR